MKNVEISNIEIAKLDPPQIETSKNKNGREFKKKYNFSVKLQYPSGKGEAKSAVCTTLRECFKFARLNRETPTGTDVN